MTRLRESVQMLAALRMYFVRILMSYLSINKNSFRKLHIIAGDLDVRCVSTPTADWLSSCKRRRRPFSSGMKLYIAHRIAFSSLKVMFCNRSGAVQNSRASRQSLSTAL